MKKLKLFFLLILLSIFTVFSQDSTAHFSIKVSPQHFIVRAFRLDFEYMFKKSIHGIVIAPSLYTGLYKTSSVANIVNSNEFVSDIISGWAVELMHKIYIININDDFEMQHKVFLGYGLNQHFIKAKIYDKGFYEEQNADEISQIFYGQKEFEQKFDRKAVFVQAGYEVIFYKRIVLDFYLGIGYRYSKMESNELKSLNKRYDKDIWEYGHTGLEPRFGFRIGVFIL